MRTPVESINGYYFKRDDKYEYCNTNGGKVRTARYLIEINTKKGITPAGSRSSPQLKILSNICEELKIPFVAHTTTGVLGDNLKPITNNKFTTVVQHKYGYNSVIIKRAKDYALDNRKVN